MDDPNNSFEHRYSAEKVSDEKLNHYNEVRSESETIYKTFGKVKCPALGNKYVTFTSEGFNHLVYRIKKQERDKRVQIMRFELLSKAKALIEITSTIQEYEEYHRQHKVMKSKRNQMINVKIRDIGFVGIIKGFRIKVVLRKIGDGGEWKFHSVIPAWSTQYYRDIKIIRNTKDNVTDS